MERQDGIEIVRQLASALDKEQFAEAATMLADRCLYDTGEETLRGPQAIIDTYRDHADRARATFDVIEYDSSVTSGDDGSYWILYTDHIRHGDLEHTYRCRQIITLDTDGRVATIAHCELPGERPELEEFFQRCGVRP